MICRKSSQRSLQRGGARRLAAGFHGRLEGGEQARGALSRVGQVARGGHLLRETRERGRRRLGQAVARLDNRLHPLVGACRRAGLCAAGHSNCEKSLRHSREARRDRAPQRGAATERGRTGTRDAGAPVSGSGALCTAALASPCSRSSSSSRIAASTSLPQPASASESSCEASDLACGTLRRFVALCRSSKGSVASGAPARLQDSAAGV